MASANGSSMGKNSANMAYADDEHAQILTAIRQPLFIQTPLQAMLESMVEKLQTQSGMLSMLQQKVNSLERTHLSNHELLDRLRVLESRLEVSHGVSSALSPFNQVEVLKRLQRLEQRAGVIEDQASKLRYMTEEELTSRLQLCESRLAGVHNLSGHLMAVDLVAAELGITVPQPQLMTQQQIQEFEQQLADAEQPQHVADLSVALLAPGQAASQPAVPDASNAAALPQQQQQQQSASSSSRPSSAAVSVRSSNGTRSNSSISSTGAGGDQHQVRASYQAVGSSSGSSGYISRPQSGRLSAGVLTRSKQAELQQQIDQQREETTRTQQQLTELQQQMSQLSSDLSSCQDSSMGLLAGLQDSHQGLADRVSQQVVQLRKEMQPALQHVAQSEVSLAEMMTMNSKLEGLVAAVAAANKDVQQIKTKELPAVTSSLSDLSRKVGRGSSAAVSDADKALARDLMSLKQCVSDLTVRLEDREAQDLVREGVATKEELKELSRLMLSKASKDDMRAVLSRAVELALEAYRSCTGDVDDAGATRTRCLVCERTLLGSRSSSPTQHSAPGGSSSSSNLIPGAQYLPPLNAFRPSTASTVYTGPAATGETLGCGPLGPGLNAAQLRKITQRNSTASSGSSNSPAGQQQQQQQQLLNPGVDDHDGDDDDDDHVSGCKGKLLQGSLMVRSSSPGFSNTVRYSSTGPYDHRQQQQQQQSGNRKLRPHTTGGIKAAGKNARSQSLVTSGVCASTAEAVEPEHGQGDEVDQQSAAAGSRASTAQQQSERQTRHRSAGKRTPVFV